MTMTEETKLPLAAVIDVEAVFGRELLDELAAVRDLLASMKPDLMVLMERAVGAAQAFHAAAGRIEEPEEDDASCGLFQLLMALSGFRALDDIACEVGLSGAICDGLRPSEIAARRAGRAGS